MGISGTNRISDRNAVLEGLGRRRWVRKVAAWAVVPLVVALSGVMLGLEFARALVGPAFFLAVLTVMGGQLALKRMNCPRCGNPWWRKAGSTYPYLGDKLSEWDDSCFNCRVKLDGSNVDDPF